MRTDPELLARLNCDGRGLIQDDDWRVIGLIIGSVAQSMRAAKSFWNSCLQRKTYVLDCRMRLSAISPMSHGLELFGIWPGDGQ